MLRYKLEIIYVFALFLIGCEGSSLFYPPNQQERLCVSAVIDINDTVKTLIFEKSHQVYYPEEQNDSIGEVYYELLNDNGILVTNSLPQSSNIVSKGLIDKSVSFDIQKEYILKANEETTKEIVAYTSIAPEAPTLLLNNITPGTIIGRQVAYVNMSFIDNSFSKNFYSIIAKGEDKNGKECLLDFYVESNIDIFYSSLPSYEITMTSRDYGFSRSTVVFSAPFFSDIFLGNSQVSFSLIIEPKGSVEFDYTKPIHIRLLSITEELFNYCKSLNDYLLYSNDPFQEPVYIKTNINNGQGVFSICQSSILTITLPWEDILGQK